MKAFIFDTETTGLIQNGAISLDLQPSVIEFFGCLVDLKKGKVLSEFDTLIKPKTSVNGLLATDAKKTITDITGITDEMLVNAPSFAEVADKIADCIEKAPLVIAQNASFDKEMIDIEFSRLDRKLEWPPVICTIEQSIHLVGHRLNLSALHLHLLGSSFPGAHRAKADTLALVRCCVEMFKRGLL